MALRGKILLLAFFAACAAAGVGVYLWYEAVLDDEAEQELPYAGPLLERVAEPLQRPAADRAEAEARLLAMPEWDRDRIVDALSRNPGKDFRMVAVAVARRLRDRPIPRAVLARLTLEDPDAKVKDAARRALNGEPGAP